MRFGKQLSKAATPLALIFRGTTGHAFVAAKVGYAPYYSMNEEIKHAFSEANAIYLQGYSLREESMMPAIEKACEIGNRSNIPIFLDISPASNMLREERRRLIAQYVDVYMSTEEELL